MSLVADTDADPKRNRISASVHFGPNMVSGVMNEVGIIKYSIFLTDVYGFRLLDGEPIINVTSTNQANGTDCCDPKAYEGKVFTQTPINYTEFRFEVAPVTDGAKEALPNGLLTGVVEDWIDLAFVSTSGAFHLSWLARTATILIISVHVWLGARVLNSD